MPGKMVDGQLVLYGVVGNDMWGMVESFSAMDVITVLAEHGRTKDLTVRLNSGGGNPFEGVAIFNALQAHGGKVKILIDAVAGSAASIIAMAGRPTVMRPGATLLIHDPSASTRGTEEDHRKSADDLNVIAEAMAEIYAMKTGRTTKDIRKEMKVESWFGADEAVSKRYADSISKDDPQVEAAAFNYRFYAHAPREFVALADENGWSKHKPPSITTPSQKKEKKMTTKQPRARLDDDVEDEVEEVEETPPKAKKLTKAEVLAQAKAEEDEVNKTKDSAKKEGAEEFRKVAASIVKLAQDAGVPTMAAKLLEDGVTLEQAQARIKSAGEIKAKVDQARKMCPVLSDKLYDGYIAAGSSVEFVGNDLLDKMSKVQAAKPTIGTHQDDGHRAEADKVEGSISPAQIYADRRTSREKRRVIA